MPWNFTLDPATGTYHSATNQNQAGLPPSANEVPDNYMPTGYYMGGPNMTPDMTFAANSAAGFMQPGSNEQNTMLVYGAYGGGTGYESVYGQW